MRAAQVRPHPKGASVRATRTRRRFNIELERETDGRWIAEIPSLPGAMAYGATRTAAERRVKALALRVLAESLEQEGSGENPASVSFATVA